MVVVPPQRAQQRHDSAGGGPEKGDGAQERRTQVEGRGRRGTSRQREPIRRCLRLPQVDWSVCGQTRRRRGSQLREPRRGCDKQPLPIRVRMDYALSRLRHDGEDFQPDKRGEGLQEVDRPRLVRKHKPHGKSSTFFFCFPY